MANNINNKSIDTDVLINTIYSKQFSSLSDERQKQILNTIDEEKRRDGGLMGRFFGTKRELASMNIAAFICIILVVFCVIFSIIDYKISNEIHMNLINTILPIISLSLGYIFGKSDDNKK